MVRSERGTPGHEKIKRGTLRYGEVRAGHAGDMVRSERGKPKTRGGQRGIHWGRGKVSAARLGHGGSERGTPGAWGHSGARHGHKEVRVGHKCCRGGQSTALKYRTGFVLAETLFLEVCYWKRETSAN